MNNSLILPILIPFLTALLCLLRPKNQHWQCIIGVSGLFFTFLAASFILFNTYHENYLVLHIGAWKAPLGITLVSDLLSGIFLVLLTFMAFITAVYSVQDIAEGDFYFPLYNFLLMGVNGALLAGDLFNLYVWFEVMLISSFVLISHFGDKKQIGGAFIYVAINLISSLMFLAATGLIYGKLGTLNIADITMKMSGSIEAPFVTGTVLLLFVAFGIKAALFPLYFWLPASYHTLPISLTAAYSGLMSKVGVYALFRLFTLIYPLSSHGIQDLLIIVAALTMLSGVLGAASHYSMRKILSFHIISQIGYMIMGLAIYTPLALAGSLFYVIHNNCAKTSLFFINGIIERKKGTDDLMKLGGFYKTMPFLTLLFFIAAFSLGGIPPLSGFWAKFSLIKASFQEELYYLGAIALLVGMMTLFSMTKMWGEIFLKAEPVIPEKTTRIGEKSKVLLWIPTIILTFLILYLSFFGQSVFTFTETAAHQMLDQASYIEAVLGESK